jgi:hypothetical protein
MNLPLKIIGQVRRGEEAAKTYVDVGIQAPIADQRRSGNVGDVLAHRLVDPAASLTKCMVAKREFGSLSFPLLIFGWKVMKNPCSSLLAR